MGFGIIIMVDTMADAIIDSDTSCSDLYPIHRTICSHSPRHAILSGTQKLPFRNIGTSDWGKTTWTVGHDSD